MSFKKIFFALLVTAFLIGGACAANINNFTVDWYNNSYNSDINSAYVNSNGDSGVSIYKNTNGVYYDYDDDGYDDDYVVQNVYNGISDDMQLSKNTDNTVSFTDHDDAEHGVVEVVQSGDEQYTVVFWAKDASNINNTDLMSKLTDFNKDNGVSPIAF